MGESTDLKSRARGHPVAATIIRASFVARHCIYGASRVFLDLHEAGETCRKHRVARLMRQANLRALHGYRIRRWAVGKPSVLIPNLLQRQFTVTQPNKAWVTDIAYSDVAGLSLPRRRDGLVLAQDRRLVDGVDDLPRALNAVLMAIRRAAPPHADSFGSGNAVRL
jgi:transposase InsO family protein